MLFLGLDLSTQGLKAAVADEDDNIVCERAIQFDRDLPHHGTKNGAIPGDEDGEMFSPVALWLESLDILMTSFVAAGVDLSAVVAVSGAAQQHGSVYWTRHAQYLLASLDPKKPLFEQLSPRAFSIPYAPIWQDSSTTQECAALEQAVGGAQQLADLTGSRAYERFTGSQISKIYHRQPSVYAATRYISLVSSFLASLFLCRIAPIEVSDASGMNLMSIITRKWDDTLLQECGGPELRSKLGDEPVEGGTVLGNIGNWWVERYGFNTECIIAPFTGDNPATVVTHSAPGDAILSLGTSTTLLISYPSPSATVDRPASTTTSHVLAHPTVPGGSILMLCYKNGALTREHIRNTYSSRSWDVFNEQILSTPAGNNGRMGFYFTLKEIIPDGVEGDHFFVDGTPLQLIQDEPKDADGDQNMTDEKQNVSFPPEAHARAVLESQLLSIRSRLETILSSGRHHHSHASELGLKRCIITGGSSANPVIRQMAADILGLPVFVNNGGSGGGSAASGGALLAKYAWWKAARESPIVDVPVLGDRLNAVGAHGSSRPARRRMSAGAVGGGRASGGDRPARRSSAGMLGGGFSMTSLKKTIGPTFENMRKEGAGLDLEKVADPHPDTETVYMDLLEEYRACEDMVVKACKKA